MKIIPTFDYSITKPMLTDREILDGLLRKKASIVKELEKINLAISLFGGNDEDYDKSANDEMTGAWEYDPTATVKEKIFFALKRLIKASAEDIVKYLILIGDKSNEDSLFKSVTLNASRLFRNGKLETVKQGRRFIYFIPKAGQMSISDAMDKLM